MLSAATAVAVAVEVLISSKFIHFMKNSISFSCLCLASISPPKSRQI